MLGIIKETQLKENRKNEIYIGIQEEQLLSNSLMLAINRLRHQYPDLTVNILRSTTAELLKGLESGKIIAKYAKEHMILLPRVHAHISDEKPIKYFEEQFSLQRDRVKFVESATPISIPVQVANGLGISIGNKTSISCIDPQIKVIELADTKNTFLKGIFYKQNTKNPYTKDLIRLVKAEKAKF